MTIITGKQARQLRASWHLLPRLTPLAVATMLLAGECRADWRVQPSLTLTETYTDNVSLQTDEFKHAQFLSEIAPGLSLNGKGRHYEIEALGHWRYFTYHGRQQENTADSILQYALNGKGELVEDLLYVDANATSGPQSISAFGPQGGSTLYALGNRAVIKTWRISPYLTQRLGRDARVTARFTRASVDADEYSPLGSSMSSTTSIGLTSGTAFQSLDWGFNYLRQDLENRISGSSTSETAIGNLRYTLTPRLALTATMGYDRYDYQALGGRTAGRNWSTGFDWTPSTRTHVSAALGRHYFGQTGKLDASHRSRHTVWQIGYQDFVTTAHQQFMLPATIDTAAMLDKLFMATISDPILRQQAVSAYIVRTGLPPSLGQSVNYLTNRFLRDRTLQASAAFSRGRSSGVLTIYNTERIALSSQQADSALLGSQLANLNDDVRQKGITATYNYRINSRSSVVATGWAARGRSITTEIKNNTREMRLALTRQLGRDLRAAVELRNMRGGVGINAGIYRENSVSASLSAQF